MDPIRQAFHSGERETHNYEVEYRPYIGTPLDDGRHGSVYLFFMDFFEALDTYNTIWATGWVEEIVFYHIEREPEVPGRYARVLIQKRSEE